MKSTRNRYLDPDARVGGRMHGGRMATVESGEQRSDVNPPERDLSASEELFRSIVEGSLQGIIVQQAGRIVYANEAMAQLFGYSAAADLIGSDPFNLIMEEDLTPFRARTDSVYRGAKITPHVGWRARHAQGKSLWVSSMAHVARWKGKPAVTSFYFDITDRKLAEIKERETQSLYQSALTAGRMGAWETDLIARKRIWTQEGMALFGITLPDGIGQVGGESDEYAKALHPEDRHLAAEFHHRAEAEDTFPAEYRVARPDGQILWLSGYGQVLSRTADGKAHRLISIMADITERKQSELHIQFLLREVSHRTKNILAVVQSIARQTAKTAVSTEDFQRRFEGRLQGLAGSHDVLVANDWRGAPLADLVRQHLAPFVGSDSARVQLTGPAVLLKSSAAQAIGLALHELATNAAKYGALTHEAGSIFISWEFAAGDEPRGAVLRWSEQAATPISEPNQKGFGHFVITNIAPRMLGGEASLEYAGGGVRWVADIPSEQILCGLA